MSVSLKNPAQRILDRVKERKQVVLERIGNRRCFMIEGKRWRGLHTPLESRFYRNYDWNIAYQKRSRSRSTKSRKESTLKSKGEKRGRSLHRQMEIWCETETKDTSAAFTKRIRNPDPATSRMIDKLTKMGIKPVASELRIYDETLGICTPLDFLGYDESDGKAVVADYKFGYVGMRDKDTGAMSEPLQKWTNCAFNQWQLFIATQSRMLAKEYNVTLDELKMMILWDEDGKEPQSIPMLEQTEAVADIVYNELASFRPTSTTRKRKRDSEKKKKKSKKKSGKKKKKSTKANKKKKTA